MKNMTPLAHIGAALALIVLLTVLFTFLPFRLPAPEPFSPWVYLAAAGICVIALFRLRGSGRRVLIYIPLLLLSIFGFLEETSYGVESGTFQPIYSETYHVQVYDVHNLLPVLEQIFNRDLQQADWNFQMSAQFFQVDGILILGLVLFCFASVWASRRGKPENIPNQVFKIAVLALILITIISIFSLISLPAESKNSFLLGFSITRLAIVAGLLIAGVLLPLLALLSQTRSKAAVRKISEWLSSMKLRWAVTIILISGLLAAIAYQFWAPLVIGTGEKAILERLNPPIIWLTAAITLFLITLAAWRGGLQTLVIRLAQGIRAFFTEHPAYIYAIVCIVIVGFAQLMDQGFVSLAQYIHFQNPWGEEWNYWLEETFEMTGAFELVAATLLLLFAKNTGQLKSPVKQKRN
jgi:uncharacterized membrane protein